MIPRWLIIVCCCCCCCVWSHPARASAPTAPGKTHNRTLIVRDVHRYWLSICVRDRPGSITGKVREISCGKATIKDYFLHPSLPLVVLRCFKATPPPGCHPNSDCMDPYAPPRGKDSARLVHVRSRKWIPVDVGFSFSPAGHAVFIRGRTSLHLVLAENLQRYVNARGRRGGQLIALPKLSTTAPRCPSRRERERRLLSWRWMSPSTLRIKVAYCLKHCRYVDLCLPDKVMRPSSDWLACHRADSAPAGALPSSCGPAGS